MPMFTTTSRSVLLRVGLGNVSLKRFMTSIESIHQAAKNFILESRSDVCTEDGFTANTFVGPN